MKNATLAFAFTLASGMLIGSIVTLHFIMKFPTGIVSTTGIL